MKRPLVFLSALALSLTACSNTTEPAPVTEPAAAELTIVASTAIWGDVAQNIANTTDVPITVTSIIEGNTTDPHHFEPTATDIAKAKEADIVVVGGGGYDAWLYESVDEATVVHAMELTSHDHDHSHEPEHSHEQEPAHDHDHDHGHVDSENEHIWYDTDAVSDVAKEIAQRINSLDSNAQADATEYVEKLEGIHERVHKLPELSVAQTEPIADYLLAHSPMKDITPEGYRDATLAEQEPTAADLAAFLELIESGKLQALIYNPQTETDMTTRIRKAAEEKSIPVIEIYETPQTDQPYLEFITQAIDRLEAAK